jgi:hypothetical protein
LIDRPAGWRARLLCASALVPYLFFTLPRLDLPGIMGEEANIVMPFFGGGIQVNFGPLRLPVSIIPGYTGALESYLVSPFILLFGPTSRALHLGSVVFGAAALCFVFFACRNYFKDNRVAWLATFLLGTLPPFVSSTYFGFYHSSAMVMFQAGAVWSLTRWRAAGRRRDLLFVFFFTGAALACRPWSAIATLSCLATAAVVFPGSWELRRLPDLCRRFGAGCLAAFLIGAFPLTLHGLAHGRQLAAAITSRLRGGDAFVKTRDSYWERLKWRRYQVQELSQGDFFLENEVFPSKGSPRLARAVMIAAAMIWALFACLADLRGFSPEQRLFCPILILFHIPIVAAMPGNPSILAYDHVLSLLAPLAVTVAVFVVELSARVADNLGRAAGAGAFLALGLLPRLWDIPDLQLRLSDMRGLSPYFSTGTAQAAQWILALPPQRLIILTEWGISDTLAFQMGNRMPPFQKFTLKVGDDLRGPLESLRGNKFYYLTYAPELDAQLCPIYLRLRVECLGSAAKVAREFRDPDGHARVVVYEIAATAPLEPEYFVPRLTLARPTAGGLYSAECGSRSSIHRIGTPSSNSRMSKGTAF